MKKSYWQIDEDNNIFSTLEDAKYHCESAYTPKERIKYLNRSEIMHIVNEEVVSTVEIRVNDRGKVSFGPARKLGFFGKLLHL